MGVKVTYCLNPSRRAGRGISDYKLVLGVGHPLGQSALCALEPDRRGLPAWLSAAGHLGHLRQGLGAPEGPARQPARLLALVSPPPRPPVAAPAALPRPARWWRDTRSPFRWTLRGKTLWFWTLRHLEHLDGLCAPLLHLKIETFEVVVALNMKVFAHTLSSYNFIFLFNL